MTTPDISFFREQLRVTGDPTYIEAVGPTLIGNDLRYLKDKFNGFVDGAVYVQTDREKHPDGEQGCDNVLYWYQGQYGIAYRS